MERFLSILLAITLGLLALIVVLGFLIEGPAGVTFALAAGVAAFILILWKAPGKIRRGLEWLQAKGPQPLLSCLLTGLAWSITAASLIAGPILLLGHARPLGWDLDHIPAFAGGAFVLGLIAGLPMGREKRRKAKPGGGR